MRFLLRLIDLLLPLRTDASLVEHATVEALGERAAPALIESDAAAFVALLPYREPVVRACILEAKYRGSSRAQGLLAAVLREYLEVMAGDAQGLRGGSFALVPIPLGKERRRARGYNQAERVCSAALASRLPGITLAPALLRRARETEPQTKLSREARLRNMEGAFAADPLDPELSYIVVDDVATTGATLAAARDALHAAGARRIELLALAH